MTASQSVSQEETPVSAGAPAAASERSLPMASGGSFGRLLRFALANVRRRPERFVLAVLGIALAIAAVTVVRTIAASSAITGADSVTNAIGTHTIWVVPAAGVTYDSTADALVADGAPSDISLPKGWTGSEMIAGLWRSPHGRVAVYGVSGTSAGTATASSELARRLGVSDGGTLSLGGHTLRVTVTGDNPALIVAPGVAEAVVGDVGWWIADEPSADQGRTDLGTLFGDAVDLPSTQDPAQAPDPAGKGLVYDTTTGSGATSFAQRYASAFSGQVTNSTLGLISVIGLILGFIIAISSFLASVQERRREFGIMSSIGLADEVLYFFLVESGVVFLASWLLGVLGAGVAVWAVLPDLATPVAWAQASATVAAFLPAMAIVGAIVPVHRLLQQRPVALLTD
ncbi:MAG: ABC transporter permease [Nocardioides sp.]|uniref:ABC transporter permease n=1 Tax=Nocardioides sp. TaxID=35761 RepID=UPI0039E25168